jgi:hypothetical protein
MDEFTEGTHRIDLLLEKALQESGFDSKILELKVFAAWKEAVGDLIARNTQPVSLVNGELTVHASHNVWVTEILMLRRHVIQEINDAVRQTAVRRLKFVVRPTNQSSRPKSQHFPPPRRLKLERVELAPEALEQIEQTVAPVEDPDLKACLKRLFIKQSQRALIDKSKGAEL